MRLLDQSTLEELLWALGEYLEAEGQRATIIIVGGASLALRPTPRELTDAAAWVREQDASESFPGLVRELVEHVREAIRNDSGTG